MNALTKLVVSMLDDDAGVSERTFRNLVSLIGLMKNSGMRSDLEAIIRQAKATDGRFYLPIE